MHLLPHRHSDDDPDKSEHVSKSDDDLTSTDYDAQADLALPTAHHELEPGDVVTPFAGSVVEQPQTGAYDMDRDIGS